MRLSILTGLTAIILISGPLTTLQAAAGSDLLELLCDETEADPAEITDLITFYQQNPLFWHDCTWADLESLPLPAETRAKLSRAFHAGIRFTSWPEFSAALNLDPDEREWVSEFIVGQPLRNSTLHYQTDFSGAEGALTGFAQRIAITSNGGWRGGLTTDYDRNEIHYLDHLKVSVVLPEPVSGLQCLAGSYRLRWGHGLFYNTSLMGSKSSDVIGNSAQRSARLSSYLGRDENRYLNGFAARYSHRGLALWTGFSSNKLDASVDNGMVKTFHWDGYHTTAGQRLGRNAVHETTLLGALHYNHPKGHIGGLWFRNRYSAGYPLFDKNGKYGGLSLTGGYVGPPFTFDFEWITTSTARQAWIATLNYLAPGIALSLQTRSFADSIWAPLGATIRRWNGSPTGEYGLYWGLRLDIARGWKLVAYLDRYRTRTMVPTVQGFELLAALHGQLGARLRFTATCKQHRSLLTSPADDALKRTFSLRTIIRLNPVMQMTIRTTTLQLVSRSVNGNGSGIHWDCRYQIDDSHRCEIGVTGFYSSSYASRIYLYEPGLPGHMNLTALYGRGHRLQAVMNKQWSRHLNGGLAWYFHHLIPPHASHYRKDHTLEGHLRVDF